MEQSVTFTPAAQVAQVEQPFASSAEGDPVHLSSSAHFAKVALAPRNVIGIPETNEEEPPAYGTTLSFVPRNMMIGTGREGAHAPIFSVARSNDAGANAANTSARWHAL